MSSDDRPQRSDSMDFEWRDVEARIDTLITRRLLAYHQGLLRRQQISAGFPEQYPNVTGDYTGCRNSDEDPSSLVTAEWEDIR